MMPHAQPSPRPPLDHALYLAGLGYRVLPIKPGHKSPAPSGWQNVATTDADLITNWWTGIYRNHGVGILTGTMADGTPFFALDIDNGDGKDGTEALAELETEHGPLPATITSHTGSGGRHILLKVPPGVECPRNDQSGHLADGIDIRGVGGQIVVAPTIHPNGRQYVWEIGAGPGEIEMAVAPWWLVGLLEKSSRVSPQHPTVTARPKPSPSDPFVTALDDGPAQRYNERTTWDDLLTADGWTLSHTDGDGEQHWTRPGKDKREGTSATVGYAGNDALKVFTSSVPWLEAERAYSRFGYYAARQHAGDRSAAARALLDDERPKVTPLTVIPVGTVIWSDPAESSQEIQEKPEPVSDADAALLAMLVDWPTFWAKDTTDAEWLAEPILAAGRAHAIYAPGGTGKSLFALWLAAQMATGGRGLTGEHLTPQRVLYLDYEMTHDDVQERLEAMGFDTATNFTNFHYALLPSLSPADQPEGGKQIGRLAQLVDAQLVVLDTFGRAVVGDENDADTIRDFYRWTAMHLKAEGRAIVRIDHAGKDIDRGQRGSSAKNDDVDVVWQMIRAEGGFTLTAKKRRMGWVPETVALQQHDDPTLHYSIVRESVPAGTFALAQVLDGLGVPATDSYRKAASVLRDAGRTAGNHLIRSAQKYRKEKQFSGATIGLSIDSETTIHPVDNLGSSAPNQFGARNLLQVSEQVGHDLAHSTNSQVTELAHDLAHVGAPLDANVAHPPSLEGGAPSVTPPSDAEFDFKPGDHPW